MIEEKFLESAIRIRKNYLKISSNLEFYHKKAKDIIQSLEDIAKKAQGLQDEINNDKKEHSVNNFGDTDRIHLIVDWIEESLFKKYDF
jgi:hypothetical protein